MPGGMMRAASNPIDLGFRDHRRRVSPHLIIRSRRTYAVMFAVEAYRNTSGRISLYVNVGERTYWLLRN